MDINWPPKPFGGILPFLLISFVGYVSPDAGVESDTSSNLPIISQSLQQEYYPFNVTVNHLSPRSVEVSWNCRGQNAHDKFEVTLKPLEASYRVIETVPYNTCFLRMDKLEPNTNYQVSVTSISGRVRKRSSSVIFRTYLEVDMDYSEISEEVVPLKSTLPPLSSGDGGSSGSSTGSKKDRLRLPRVRLVEISLVGMALILWAGAIVLFFHRWGKIRMLLPYQPDYKEMKRTNSVCANCSMTPHHQCCRIQQIPYPPFGAEYVGSTIGVGPGPPTPSHRIPINVNTTTSRGELGSVPVTDTGCSPIRPRLNSFIVSDINDSRKDDPVGVPRKTRSAEQLERYSSFMEDCYGASGGQSVSVDVACTEF